MMLFSNCAYLSSRLTHFAKYFHVYPMISNLNMEKFFLDAVIGHYDQNNLLLRYLPVGSQSTSKEAERIYMFFIILHR